MTTERESEQRRVLRVLAMTMLAVLVVIAVAAVCLITTGNTPGDAWDLLRNAPPSSTDLPPVP